METSNFLKSEELTIDFSAVNIAELTKQSYLLGQILIENGMGLYVDYLSQIRLAAYKKDETEFRRLIVSRELFGGAGSLWEVYIDNRTEYIKFNNQFCDYTDLIIRMGIKNERIKKTQKIRPEMN